MAKTRLPSNQFHPSKQAISLRVDVDVLTWFKAGGPGYQTRMLAVLRRHVQAEGASGAGNSVLTVPGPSAAP